MIDHNSLSQPQPEIYLQDKVTVITEDLLKNATTNYITFADIEILNLQKQNIFCFRNNREIHFPRFTHLITLNLSYNFIKDISDLKLIPSLKSLVISHNRIDDISVCDSLPNLEDLNAEDNEIFSIASVGQCPRLSVLRLMNNKMKYHQSTVQVLSNLKSLKVLTMKNNPFLEDIFGYRHLFIYKFSNLDELDNERITEVDKEVARRFTMENYPVSGPIRPKSARVNIKESLKGRNVKENEIGDDDTVNVNDDCPVHQPTTERNRITYIDKAEINRWKQNGMTNSNSSDSKLLAQLKDENRALRQENKILKEQNQSKDNEIQSLQLEVENLTKIINDYESLIRDSKKHEQVSQKEATEKINLRQQLELWKKEYCDLLDKTVSTNLSGNIAEPASSSSSSRPHTAQVYCHKSSDLDSIVNELNRIKERRKNSLDDSLNDDVILKDEKNIKPQEIVGKSKSKPKIIKETPKIKLRILNAVRK